eukprot:TRINITY_DN100589_c0_g1_i1.p1 TRINITY_DN100589_c0_g1~~TRINITY_DN100589_c0_g1_i1.p1  ORF type:complete len:129 (+),score=33.57 TRINITY_DN100589_c0_g1_i1:51-437(+)
MSADAAASTGGAGGAVDVHKCTSSSSTDSVSHRANYSPVSSRTTPRGSSASGSGGEDDAVVPHIGMHMGYPSTDVPPAMQMFFDEELKKFEEAARQAEEKKTAKQMQEKEEQARREAALAALPRPLQL